MRMEVRLATLASLVGVCLGGCASGPSPAQINLAQDGQCQSWGHKPGSPGYAQCRENLYMDNQRFEAEKRAAGMQLIQRMQSPQPAPPVYQMPMIPYGLR